MQLRQKIGEEALSQIDFHRFVQRKCPHSIEFMLSVSLPPISLRLYFLPFAMLALWLSSMEDINSILFRFVLFIYALLQNANMSMHKHMI
ncbi:hypothetical protein RJT34_00884 [Clitoria ternatea]|uniref:Uncharacterized protein n=1 Tax=Clitoria ternatea TaxID=43366 RepID=A0AAN9KHN6_CLITE